MAYLRAGHSHPPVIHDTRKHPSQVKEGLQTRKRRETGRAASGLKGCSTYGLAMLTRREGRVGACPPTPGVAVDRTWSCNKRSARELVNGACVKECVCMEGWGMCESYRERLVTTGW